MLSRRSFIKLLAIAAVLPVGGGLLYKLRSFEFPVKPLLPIENQTIQLVVDLILPQDELSPGAVDLEVDIEILDRAEKNRYLRRLLKKGVSWLNTQASHSSGKLFLSLPEADQILLIEKAEMAEFNTAENRFFRQIRNLTFEHYYTKRDGWSVLCYPGPPQPLGFVDYQSPPQGCGSSA